MNPHEEVPPQAYDAWPGADGRAPPGSLAHEYNTRAWASDFQQTLDRHRGLGEAVRQSPGALLAIPWGARPRQRMDLLLPNAQRGPMVLYLHGGFWQFRSSGKEGGAFLAPEFLKRGIAYAGVSYELCPDIRMDEMVTQVREAVQWLVNRAPGFGYDIERLTLVGHSAGAHLAVMAALTDWEHLGLRRNLIAGVCGVSGIYDLQPLIETPLNSALRLTPQEADRCSPIHRLRAGAPPMLLSFGSRESGEFKRQTADFARACAAHAVDTTVFELLGRDHYAAIEDVVARGHPLSVATMALALGAAQAV